MTSVTPRRAPRSVLRTFTLFTAGLIGLACAGDDPTSSGGPQLPGEPAPNPVFRSASFVFDVDMTTRKVRITSPAAGVANPSLGAQGLGAPSLSLSPGGPQLSIVAGDVIELITENFQATGIGTGGAPAGKVRATFDVKITNRLTGVELITPTFPTPPAGVSGVLLFPYEAVTTVTPGGTSVTGDGTVVLIELPSNGDVEASVNWDGAPHNFFNDAGCTTAGGDCFRYEVFPTIPAGATTDGFQVGFDLTPTVSRFRARLIVAADLRSATLATGTISGTVSSAALGGPVAGVTVSAGGTWTAVTDAAGSYTIPNVNVGSRTVQIVAGLPAGCTFSPVSVTVPNGGTATANFPLANCTVPSGTVSGSILSSLGGGIAGIGVVLTPDGGVAQPAATTDGAGAFSASVPVIPSTSGRITALSNIPANCTPPTLGPGLFEYSGLTTGGTVIIPAITLSCTVPEQRYALAGTWSTSGSTATLELRIQMGTAPGDPVNNGSGADRITGGTFDVTYDNTLLTPVDAVTITDAGEAAPFSTFLPNTGFAVDRVRVIVAQSGAGGLANEGSVGIVRINFTRIAAGAVTPVIAVVNAAGPGTTPGATINITSKVDVTASILP